MIAEEQKALDTVEGLRQLLVRDEELIAARDRKISKLYLEIELLKGQIHAKETSDPQAPKE